MKITCVGWGDRGDSGMHRRPPGTTGTASLIGRQDSQKGVCHTHYVKIVNLNSDCQAYATLVMCRSIQVLIYNKLKMLIVVILTDCWERYSSQVSRSSSVIFERGSQLPTIKSCLQNSRFKQKKISPLHVTPERTSPTSESKGPPRIRSSPFLQRRTELRGTRDSLRSLRTTGFLGCRHSNGRRRQAAWRCSG